MANFKLDLSKDYATQMLSFYLYGKEAAGQIPARDKIANSKWIRNETMTVDVNSVAFMEATGLKNFNPYEFAVIRRFFNKEHEKNTGLIISDFKNEIILPSGQNGSSIGTIPFKFNLLKKCSLKSFAVRENFSGCLIV